MKVKNIETWRKIFPNDATEKYVLRIKLLISQEELDKIPKILEIIK